MDSTGPFCPIECLSCFPPPSFFTTFSSLEVSTTSSFDGGRASCRQLEMNEISSETPPIHDVQPFTVAAPSMESPSTLTGASSDVPSQQGQFFNLIFSRILKSPSKMSCNSLNTG